MRQLAPAFLFASAVLVSANGRTTGIEQRRPNFVEDVAPILHANCIACHRPGTPAPFSLLSYDDARARAKEMREAVSSRQMPPWSAMAASGYPALSNDRRLAARDINTITAWIDAGAPSG